MFRLLFLATLVLLPAIAGAATADGFALRCEREMQPAFEVHLRESRFDVHNEVSSRVLHTRETHGAASQLMLGLTSGTIRTEVLFDAPGLLDRGAKRECVAPRVEVDLSYDPLRVYVAREFNTYSCAYRTIYEHEMRHVEVYRTELPKVRAAIREALAQHFPGPLYAPAGEGLQRLSAEVDDWLRPLVRLELARVADMQHEIDSPEEEFRLKEACGGEVASTLGAQY